MINVYKNYSYDYGIHLEATFQSRLTDNLFLKGGFLFMLVDDIVKEFIFELQVQNLKGKNSN
ncbi:hypothetical protein [Clostridium massiliamazoniense]|uniref:hypothetical protein n=1 Tax=Clostridium massiliamazoniense TaxID=1347366 RepID=UPI0006D791B5|nr:hypothetical protein [Clostridium massiliamazoniense]